MISSDQNCLTPVCSLLEKHPELREKNFKSLLKSKDLEGALRRHGASLVNALGTMVTHVKNDDDARLVQKVHEVSWPISKVNLFSSI